MNTKTTAIISTLTGGIVFTVMVWGFLWADRERETYWQGEVAKAKKVANQPGARLDGCIVTSVKHEDAEYYSTTTVQCEDGRLGMFLVPKNGARLGIPESASMHDLR